MKAARLRCLEDMYWACYKRILSPWAKPFPNQHVAQQLKRPHLLRQLARTEVKHCAKNEIGL